MTTQARDQEPSETDLRAFDAPPKVAVISLHTSPLDQPGAGDSGGMNVYVVEVAERLAEQGIAADIYTRCHGSGAPAVQQIARGTWLTNVQAGPCGPVPKEDIASHIS